MLKEFVSINIDLFASSPGMENSGTDQPVGVAGGGADWTHESEKTLKVHAQNMGMAKAIRDLGHGIWRVL